MPSNGLGRLISLGCMGWTSIGKNLRGGELDSHHNILEVVSKVAMQWGKKKKDLMDTVKEEPTGLDT